MPSRPPRPAAGRGFARVLEQATAGGLIRSSGSTPQTEFGSMTGYMARLRDRWGDSLLTLLTALLAVMMFVLAPLQALGYFVFQVFELAVALTLIACVFVLSGSRTVVVA